MAIDAYLEADGDVDRALTEFALRYERQNRLDFEAFGSAIDCGRLRAHRDL